MGTKATPRVLTFDDSANERAEALLKGCKIDLRNGDIDLDSAEPEEGEDMHLDQLGGPHDY